MLSKHRVVGVVIGVFEFVATHLLLVTKWTTWFHGPFEPWFLNSASAGAFTVACLFAGSLVAGLFDISGVFVWVGAVTAMTLVLVIPPGPGTLWPIAMVIGGAILAVAILGGNMLGFGIRYVVAKSRSTRLAGR
jgi:hypothetical protein